MTDHASRRDAAPTIVEFLNARLDERERRIRHGFYFDAVDSIRGPDWGQAKCELPGCWWASSGGYETPTGEEWDEHAGLVHEADWVLADIGSKRRIIHQHAGSEGGIAHECPEGFMDRAETDPHTGWMRDCPTLKLLALPFDSHPDYRKEWAV